MKVIIAGGTGFIGQAISRALKNRGDEVLLVSRHPGEGRITWKEIESQGLPTSDGLINLAGANLSMQRWTPEFRNEIYSSRIESTLQLADAVQRALSPPKVFISTSAIGWYPPDEKKYFTENSPPSNRFLGIVSRHWEAASALKPESVCRHVVLRLGFVLGKESPAMQLMLRAFKMGLGGKIGSGKQPFAWIHIDDVVAMYLFALDHPNVEGVFNCVAPQMVTNAEFTRTLGSVLHRPTCLTIPRFILKLLLGARATLMTEGSFVIPECAIRSGFSFHFPTLDAALKEIISTS